MTPASVDTATEARLGELLRTESFGRSVRWYQSVGSTNTVAAEWAAGDAPDGSLVGAEAQTAGRGRFDRTWTTEPGKNLTFSLILFPGLKTDRLGMISIAFSVAVASLLRDLVRPGEVEIKWPNDILIGGKKVCGMLQESAFPVGGTSGRVIIGIGLNVNQTEFPQDLAGTATSIQREGGQPIDRIRLLTDLLFEMEQTYKALHMGKDSIIRARYEANMESIGRRVTYARTDGTTASGFVTGIDRRGGLIIVTPNASETVFAGDVTITTT